MNGSYFSNPTFPSENNTTNEKVPNNIGTIIKVHTKFDKEFDGRLENISNNFILLNDINNKKYYMINNNDINYISSNEELKI